MGLLSAPKSDFEAEDTNTRNSEYHLTIMLLIHSLMVTNLEPTVDRVIAFIRWLPVNASDCS